MRVYQINIFGNLSTGRIATDLYSVLQKNGDECRFAFARNDTAPGISYYKIGTKGDVIVHGVLTRLTDKTAFYSRRPTQSLIEDIKAYKPDVILLHNLHGYYINVEVLFNFLRESKIPVVWTLHDCWSYTGHCCHYSAIKCEKWKIGCNNCQNLSAYPASKKDNSIWNYKRKKELFTELENMTLVTVSKWLEREVKKSFMQKYPVQTIYNGIDLDVFRPVDSDIKSQIGCADKKVILGVASTWHKNKGLSDFIQLSTMLNSNYKIVLVGLTKKMIRELPTNIIGIERMDSIDELVKLYSAADIFFNASIEETFGLPTVEAMACGTPSIVYDCTALPEVCAAGGGYVVKAHDLNAVIQRITSVNFKDNNIENIRKCVFKYEKNIQYQKYINLFNQIIRGG